MHGLSLKERLRALRKRWDEYVGDRDLELKIRAELVRSGLPRSAPIRDVRLVAIERPGWVQIYRFRIDGPEVERHGVASDDGRRGTRVRLFETVVEADRLASAWSEGMIVRKR